MARMTFKAGEDYMQRLSRLSAGSGEIAKKAIYEAAGIVTDAIRENLGSVLSGTSSGDLSDSLGITPILQDEKGDWNAKIGFDGYDSKGIPNQLKARVLESGSSHVQKRPFVRPAVQRTRNQATKMMNRIIEEEIQKKMN